jgi:hypothetical protein
VPSGKKGIVDREPGGRGLPGIIADIAALARSAAG